MENLLSGAWSVFHTVCMPIMVWMAVSDPTGFVSGHIIGGYSDIYNTVSNAIGSGASAAPAMASSFSGAAALPTVAVPAGCHVMNGALMSNATMGPCLG